jgi:hypothetical protein
MKRLIGFNAIAVVQKGPLHFLFLGFIIRIIRSKNFSQLVSIIVARDLLSVHTVIDKAAIILVRLRITILILITE